MILEWTHTTPKGTSWRNALIFKWNNAMRELIACRYATWVLYNNPSYTTMRDPKPFRDACHNEGTKRL